MADRDAAKLRGPVRAMRFHRDHSGYRGELLYDREGRLIENSWTNPDGSTGRTASRYRADGRLEETRHEFEATVTRHVRVYDDQGRLARVEHIAPDGSRRELERWSYEADGRKTRIQPIEANHGVGIEASPEAFSISMKEPGTATTRYDREGRPVELLLHNQEHELSSRIEYAYDNQGRLARQKHSHGARSPLDEIARAGDIPPEALRALEGLLGAGAEGNMMTFRYDERGRLIEKVSGYGPMGGEVTRYEYAEHDEPIRETAERNQAELNVVGGRVTRTPQTEQVRVVDYEYAFDRHGNWTRRTVSGEGFSNTEYREFEYFDDAN